MHTDQDLAGEEKSSVDRDIEMTSHATTYRGPAHDGDLVLYRPLFEYLHVDLCQSFPLDLVQLEHEFGVRLVGQSPGSLLSRDVGDHRELGIRRARLGRSDGYETLVTFKKTLSEGFQPVLVDVHSEGVSPWFEGGGGSLVSSESIGQDDGLESEQLVAGRAFFPIFSSLDRGVGAEGINDRGVSDQRNGHSQLSLGGRGDHTHKSLLRYQSFRPCRSLQPPPQVVTSS